MSGAQEPGVSAVFKPESAAAPGTLTWLVFATQREPEGEPVATVWECRPEDGRLVKRCELLFSDWGADLLFSRDPALCPELVRLQANSRARGSYTTWLYRFSYTTWDIAAALDGRTIIGLDATPTHAFLRRP